MPTPELLAPAGTIEAGLTALDAGADAVYAGLDRWSARKRAQNLSLDELSKLLNFARRQGRKVYVALNTLIKQSELAPLSELLVELSLLRPDGIIVQDLGLLRLLRERFSELEIHASTQMALHNSAGLEAAHRLGISRVILERQTTLEEIATMSRRSPVELEVFVHGALCASRSGLCLLSSWIGGKSGNRGRCKQPCRRKYSSESREGFLLSPGALSGLGAIAELRRLGIAALKIEGRLKRPDYVRQVVRAYRLLLDAPLNQIDEAMPEARELVAQAAGRTEVPMFRVPADFDDALRPELPPAAGVGAKMMAA